METVSLGTTLGQPCRPRPRPVERLAGAPMGAPAPAQRHSLTQGASAGARCARSAGTQRSLAPVSHSTPQNHAVNIIGRDVVSGNRLITIVQSGSKM